MIKLPISYSNLFVRFKGAFVAEFDNKYAEKALGIIYRLQPYQGRIMNNISGGIRAAVCSLRSNFRAWPIKDP